MSQENNEDLSDVTNIRSGGLTHKVKAGAITRNVKRFCIVTAAKMTNGIPMKGRKLLKRQLTL